MGRHEKAHLANIDPCANFTTIGFGTSSHLIEYPRFAILDNPTARDGVFNRCLTASLCKIDRMGRQPLQSSAAGRHTHRRRLRALRLLQYELRKVYLASSRPIDVIDRTRKQPREQTAVSIGRLLWHRLATSGIDQNAHGRCDLGVAISVVNCRG